MSFFTLIEKSSQFLLKGRRFYWLVRFLKLTRLYETVVFHKKNQDLKEWTEDNEKTKKFFAHFLREKDLVFDVGANYGFLSRIFLKMGCKVIAFEPQKICISFMKKYYRNDPNFTLIEKGLGEKEEIKTFYLSEDTGLSSFSNQWVSKGIFAVSWEEKEKIEISTLDKFISEYGIPRFIKIDVEGFEYEVLQGLSTAVDFISFEFHLEYLENTFNGIEKLSQIASYEFLIDYASSHQISTWMSQQEIIEKLKGPSQPNTWGDIYAKRTNLT